MLTYNQDIFGFHLEVIGHPFLIRHLSVNIGHQLVGQSLIKGVMTKKNSFSVCKYM